MERNGPLDLTGKVAVVTGSGRGLGLAYAKGLAQAGAVVVVNDVDAAAAEAAVKEITDTGGRAVAEVAAIGPSEAAQALVDRAVSEFGRLDVMVTNAGVLRDKVLWKMTDDDFDTVVQVHLRGTFTCARAAAVRFREQGEGGRIIVVGSPAGQRGNFGQTNYAAAKFGVIGFTKTWSRELGPKGIRVNAVAPGFVETPILATIPDKVLQHMREQVPMHRLGKPEEIANVYAFLASDEASYINGAVIEVSGGMTV